MSQPTEPNEQDARPPDHLRPIRGIEKWGKLLLPTGGLFLILAATLTVIAPNALWFLAYPLLILAAGVALIFAAALLLRHL